MALSVFLHGSRRLPVLNTAVSKLLTTQFKNSQLIITPVLAKKFSGFNRQTESKKLNPFLVPHRNISHSAIWTVEKILSAALLAVIPGCLMAGGIIADNILVVASVVHMHWGVESVVVDYIRPSLVGKVLPPIARALVYVLSALTLGGLLYFNYNDIGVTAALKRLWAITPYPPDCECDSKGEIKEE